MVLQYTLYRMCSGSWLGLRGRYLGVTEGKHIMCHFFARRRPAVDDFRAYVILQRMDSLDLKKIARACPARPKLFAGWRALKICSSVEGSIQNFSAGEFFIWRPPI